MLEAISLHDIIKFLVHPDNMVLDGCKINEKFKAGKCFFVIIITVNVMQK